MLWQKKAAHTKAIHPSSGDLASLFARYQRGDITDTENFKFIIVAPEYVVVLQIEDTYKMNALLNNGFLELKDNKYKLSDNAIKDYDNLMKISVHGLQTVEIWFNGFVLFNNEYQLGLNINLYKIDENNKITSKLINNTTDIIRLVNKTNTCNH